MKRSRKGGVSRRIDLFKMSHGKKLKEVQQ
jgi:hypothetical protein